MSKDTLSRFLDMLDGILSAKNKVIFDQKHLQIIQVMMSRNKSHIEYEQSWNKDNQSNRGVTDNNNHHNYQQLNKTQKDDSQMGDNNLDANRKKDKEYQGKQNMTLGKEYNRRSKGKKPLLEAHSSTR